MHKNILQYFQVGTSAPLPMPSGAHNNNRYTHHVRLGCLKPSHRKLKTCVQYSAVGVAELTIRQVSYI